MSRFGAVAACVPLAAIVLLVGSHALGGPVRTVIVSGRSMEPALRSGDLAVLLERSAYRPGDVIAFRVPEGEPGAGGLVIHRVVGGSAEAGYVTQGDNRDGRDPWRPRPDDVLGTTALHLPTVGHLPSLLATPVGLGLAAALLVFSLVAGTPANAARAR